MTRNTRSSAARSASARIGSDDLRSSRPARIATARAESFRSTPIHACSVPGPRTRGCCRPMIPATRVSQPWNGKSASSTGACCAGCSRASRSDSVQTRAPAHPLLVLVEALALQPPRLRGPARPRLPARLRHVPRPGDELFEPSDRVAAVVVLGAVAVRLDHDLVVPREPAPGEAAQAILARLVEQRRRADAETQLAGRCDLVDVLAAGARAPDVGEGVLAFGDHVQSWPSAEGVTGPVTR